MHPTEFHEALEVAVGPRLRALRARLGVFCNRQLVVGLPEALEGVIPLLTALGLPVRPELPDRRKQGGTDIVNMVRKKLVKILQGREKLSNGEVRQGAGHQGLGQGTYFRQRGPI